MPDPMLSYWAFFGGHYFDHDALGRGGWGRAFFGHAMQAARVGRCVAFDCWKKFRVHAGLW